MLDLVNKQFGHQLLAFIASMIVGFVLTFASIEIALKISNSPLSFSEIGSNTNFKDPEVLRAMKIMIPLQTIFFFGAAALLYAFFAQRKWWAYLNINSLSNYKHYAIGVLALLTSLGFVSLLAVWNKQIPLPAQFITDEAKYNDLTKVLLNNTNIGQLIGSIITIALLPAVCEELLFRGCLQRILTDYLSKRSFWIAILIAATVFSLLHGQMQTALPRIYLGIILGLLYHYSGSIWVPILAHFVNNAFQVVLNYILVKKGSTPLVDISTDAAVAPWQGLVSLVISSALLFYLYTQRVNYKDSKFQF
jgi:uncharacterized protein